MHFRSLRPQPSRGGLGKGSPLCKASEMARRLVHCRGGACPPHGLAASMRGVSPGPRIWKTSSYMDPSRLACEIRLQGTMLSLHVLVACAVGWLSSSCRLLPQGCPISVVFGFPLPAIIGSPFGALRSHSTLHTGGLTFSLALLSCGWAVSLCADIRSNCCMWPVDHGSTMGISGRTIRTSGTMTLSNAFVAMLFPSIRHSSTGRAQSSACMLEGVSPCALHASVR